MVDHADALQSVIESTKKCCSFMSGLLCSLLSRHCTNLVGSPFSGSNKFLRERDPHSTFMDTGGAIEITSSGSDSSSWDLDEYREILDATSPLKDSTSSDNHRVLPNWNSAVGTTSRGHVGPSQQVSSRKGSSANGSSSNVDRHAESRLQMHPSKYVGASNRHATSAENSKYYKENVHEKLPYQQILKRTLPTSLQPFPPGSRASSFVENVSHSQVHDTHGKSHHFPMLNLPTSKSHRDHFGRSTDDDVTMYDNHGNRILPQSFMHGKSVANMPYVAYNDPIPRPGLGEERAVGSDERLIYQAALQDLNQPKVEANLPDGILSVSLLKHQKIALAWMLQKEAASLHCLGGILADDQGLGKTISIIALIQMQRSLESKSKTEGECNHSTEALNLDDDDDNGSIAPDKGKQPAESVDVKLIPDVTTSNSEFRRRRPAAGTLVVCPATVLRQWAQELRDKVTEEAELSVLVYHGGSRTKDPLELAKYDVVLTTYAIVTNEVPKQPLVDEDDDEHKNGENYGISSEFSNKKRKSVANVSKKRKKGKKGFDISAIDDCGTLARVGWFRVVLDEAQTIKNHRTQVARACCGLRAKRRWCLSGTPIQNAIDELYSYFRFLKYDPYASYKSFCQQIKFPIARNSIHGYKKLQAVLRAIMLRRTKGTLINGEPIISLPPKTIHLTKVDFSPEERAFYAKLESDSRSQFKAYAAAGTLNQNYANILLMLLRLRQACDHPLLVKGFTSDPVERDSLKAAKRLPRDMLVKLLNVVDTSLAICQLCSDPPEDAVITMCGHVFCYQCVSECLTGDDNMCPAHKCKEQIGPDVVFSKATLRTCISEDPDSSAQASSKFPEKSIVLKNEYNSCKIRAVIEILQSHSKSKKPDVESHDLVQCNSDSLYPGNAHLKSSHSGGSPETVDLESETENPIKAIIFSQWTGMLDLVEVSLNQHSIKYRRLDGTMTLVARDRAVKEFNTYPEVTVMLMSLKAGNLGLNMVAACYVILLDLWWNPTTEDQAIDRAHRIGQTRPVTVSRMTVKDTVEDRILALQEEKRKMVASAFGEDPSGASTARLTVEDLKYLFFA